jgi:hypothetical protein
MRLLPSFQGKTPFYLSARAKKELVLQEQFKGLEAKGPHALEKFLEKWVALAAFMSACPIYLSFPHSPPPSKAEAARCAHVHVHVCVPRCRKRKKNASKDRKSLPWKRPNLGSGEGDDD